MGWTYVDTIPGVSGGGPNPTDDFSMRLIIADTILAQADAMRVAFTFPESLAAQADAATLAIVIAESNAVPTDALTKLAIGVSDGNVSPTDAATYAIALALNDTNAAPSDAVKIALSLADSNAAPSDAKTTKGYFWLSGSTGSSGNTTNPTNADGANDGTSGTAKTVALGATTARITSNVGSNIPNGTTFSAAIYRGWFSFGSPSALTVPSLILHSSTAAFLDITMLTSTGTAENHLTGDFTFDLVAAGVNTLAKLQSCQVYHQVVDSLTGSGTTVTVDAGRIELTGIF